MASTDFDSIQFLGPNAQAMVTLTKPGVFPVATVPDGESMVTVDTEETFGVAGDGTPYFSPGGAAQGEHADLVVTASGMAFLDPTGV